jgi:hypothetical protein
MQRAGLHPCIYFSINATCSGTVKSKRPFQTHLAKGFAGASFRAATGCNECNDCRAPEAFRHVRHDWSERGTREC